MKTTSLSSSPFASPLTPLHEKWRGRKNNKKSLARAEHFKHFILWGGAMSMLLMALSTTLFCFVFAPRENFFFNLAAAIIVSWMFMLTLYYVWAIYFYNINRGRPHPQPLSMKNGEGSGVPHGDTNPNSDETLGLPPGTVRGTLALSVLVLGMAMMIASLAMPSFRKESEVMIDHFEFLKTGFVMVIAFYFGTKSLEILRDRRGASAKQRQRDASAENETPNSAG